MPRPKRQRPNDLKNVHDRRTTDLLRNAQVAPIEVDCPLEKGATLIVMRSTRDDPLGNLYARKSISLAHFQAGRMFQADFECVERPAQAVDPSKPYVDCSRNPQPLSDSYSRSLVRLNRANRELGQNGSALVHDVLVAAMDYQAIAVSRGLEGDRWEKYFGMRFRECLETLAIIYGFATEKTGRHRIEVKPGKR